MIAGAFQLSGRYRSMAWIAAVELVSVTKAASLPARVTGYTRVTPAYVSW